MGFAQIGQHVRIARRAYITGLENISIGSNVQIDECRLSAYRGTLKIGDYVHIAADSHLMASSGLILEDFTAVSHGTRIYTASDVYDGSSLTNPTVPTQFKKKSDEGPVAVRKHAIIGAESVVLPNLEIGEGASVGAMSLVTKTLEPWTIYAGIPARKIRARSRALLADEQRLRNSDGS